ncbi:NADAR family protein [Empedobacter brevis]|uniref:NADAR domain-containing protein n=1 Tax=Empedobacter brevis NBRC 14943 = ATCC 43319 TaxID=1218108 RepID=A0A511NDN2_9FLAO|nr:NADAR family protein [Empedobacter brevis]GEM50598.1 hypothetical protein EB1_03880 [Empedobacter brevis NBRC 14943 = ATCC 43319]
MMRNIYTINWLIEQYENGKKLDFIYFWGHSSKYHEEVGKFCFSQWFPSEFVVNGKLYKSAEHWMMSQKAILFNDIKSFEAVLQTDSPKIAKEIGRNVKHYNNEIWDTVKYKIVVAGNFHKFYQNEKIRDFLLNTAEKIIVEASPEDTIWGIGLAEENKEINNLYLWRGENLLGFVLMEVRNILKQITTNKLHLFTITPPWVMFPGIPKEDMFWGMGKGEDYLREFYTNYSSLNSEDQFVYSLSYLEPIDWFGFYEEL